METVTYDPTNIPTPPATLKERLEGDIKYYQQCFDNAKLALDYIQNNPEVIETLEKNGLRVSPRH